MQRPILVGETNPYGSDQRYALYPAPAGSAGHRLCHFCMGLKVTTYIGSFERANLCTGKWKMKDARIAAAAIRERSTDGRVVVLLGARVCAAFGVEFRPFEGFNLGILDGNCMHKSWKFVILPHPSGRSRLWNAPDAPQRARALLATAGVAPFAATVSAILPDDGSRGVVCMGAGCPWCAFGARVRASGTTDA